MNFNPRHSIDDGFALLTARLDPIIAAKLRADLGGLSWPIILSQLDDIRGRIPGVYQRNDLQAQLRMLTEKLGDIGFPFDNQSRLASTLGNELRIMRNRWAHNDELDTIDAWRAHDFAVRLLDYFGDVPGAVSATTLRDAAFEALVAERGGVAPELIPELPSPPPEPMPAAGAEEVIEPDASVFTRPQSDRTPTIGAARDEFQPWAVVTVGDVSVLDTLTRKASKEQVRAVAAEIAQFEGPIQMARLAHLTAASFGLRRLAQSRERKLNYQIRQTGLLVDGDKFVWPTDIDPAQWNEFRPNDSTVDRPFVAISPIEIANAMRFIRAQRPVISDAELTVATLRTFGRKRRTKQVLAHLAAARRLA